MNTCFEGNYEILWTIFQQGITRLRYTSKPGRGFIYFITLRLISSTRPLYCAKRKRSVRVTAHLQLNKSFADGQCTRIYYTVVRSEKLKTEKVTYFLVFLSLVYSDHGFQIGRRVSPDICRPILYHVKCFTQ